MIERMRLACPPAVGLVLVLVLFASQSSQALSPDRAVTQYVKDVWQVSDGLPQATVLALAQTTDGYLWLAAEEGLARFDGVRFVAFDRSSTPALPPAMVQTIVATRDGSLWVGTFGAGLIRFDGQRFVTFAEKDGLVGKSVFSFAEDREGGLWIGTDRGINLMRGGRLVPHPLSPAADLGPVKMLLSESNGALWAGTDQGLTRLLPGPPHTYSERDGLPRATITALHQDPHGVLWVGTDRGLARREGDHFVAYTPRDGLSDNFVSSLASDGDALWIGTNGGGLQRLLHGRFETLQARDGLPTNLIVALLPDTHGNLWVGTRGGGLVGIKEGDFVTLGRGQGVESEIVDCIVRRKDGSLWVGGMGGHLYRVRPDGVVEPQPMYPEISGSGIRALYEDQRGDLWIGSWSGLHLLSGGRVTTRRVAGLSNVRVIAQDRAGSLWVGTDSSGLFHFDGDVVRRFTTREGLPSDHVRAIHQDAQGRLWIGTYGGLAWYDDGRFKNLTTIDGLPSDLVRTLYEDREGALWIGTYGGGLARLTSGRLESWTTRDGLFNDVAYEIVEDERGNLWVSCNRGVYRVSRKELEDLHAGRSTRIRSAHYGVGDGLASQECNGGNPSGLRTPDGRLWFLTVRGIVVVDPARLREPRHPLPVRIEQMLVDGRSAASDHTLEIAPGPHNLEFHYTGLNLAEAPRLRFRYRLVGFDSAWTDVGPRRVAYFTGLPNGRYAFEVSATLDGTTWSATAASRGFRVLPRFYETPLAYAVAVLGAVSVGFAVQQLRVRRIRARARTLKAEVDAALANVHVLSGLLPMCAWCKQVRDDQGYWNQIDAYISGHSRATFTHGICPECAEKVRAERSATGTR